MSYYSPNTSATFVGYSQSTYIPYPTPKTKEDKVKDVLRSIDDSDRLKDILKQVKAGKLSPEDAVDIIQADEQFHRPAPVDNNWHQWQDPGPFAGTTWIDSNGTITYSASTGTTVTYPFSHGSTSQ